MVRDRRDAESEAMQLPTDPHRVLAELNDARQSAQSTKRDGEPA